ncbi:MAG: T9SS type A sorting domain-containing protein [Flavobacterium sp.]
MKKTLLTLFLLWICHSNAQQSVNASGATASGSGGSASYTIGQIDYTAITAGSGSMNQGVQQPFEIYALGTDDFPSITIQAAVYPNPTVGNISLSIKDYAIDNLYIQLYDVLGKVIAKQQVTNNETLISMGNLSSGTYLLQVTEKERILKTFKIIKK